MNSPPDELMSENMISESAADIDLLLQFQCMGTNDRDVLVAEFQRLLGPSTLRPEACAFFLEMNNWNLQQAICSYFDFDSPRELVTQQSQQPAMTLIRDVTVGDGEEVTPNTRFIKTWKIQNSGEERWPVGCSLRFACGAQMTASDGFLVEALEPGQMYDLSIEMISPSHPGIYEGQWRMTTPSGMAFGEVIWVIVSVAEGGLLGLTQQMNSFHSLGSHSGSSLNHSLTATPSTPLVTVTTPEAATVTIAGGVFLNPFHRSGRSVSEACASALHNANIDRVKSVTADDNQENCIKICKDILTRSNSSSPDTRRSSVSFSPLAVSDLSSRSAHFPPSSSSPSSSHQQQPQQWAGNAGHEQPLSYCQQPHSLPLPQQPASSSNQTTSTAATSFPPTPPSDDMMMENN